MDFKEKLRNLKKAGRTKQRRTATKKTSPRKTSALTPEDWKMFAGFKIPKALVDSAGISRVDAAQSRAMGITAPNPAGVAFPHCAKTGEAVTFSVRLDHPGVDEKGKANGKYQHPAGPKPTLYVHPQSITKLKDTIMDVVLVEAEKSVLALTAYFQRTEKEMVAIGLGGCWGWKRDKKAAPALLDFCKGHTVIIMLDSNVATKKDVQAAQAQLIAELRRPEYACPEVLVAQLPQLKGVNGPDDLLALTDGDEQMAEALIAEPAAEGDEFSEDVLAIKFTELHGDDLRYVPTWGWLRWDGQRWERDEARRAFNMARVVCRDATESESKHVQQRIRSAQTRAAVVSMASQDEQHIATVEQWDADHVVVEHSGRGGRPAHRKAA